MDCCLVLHEDLANYQDFTITSMPEVMEKQDLQVDTTLSDHSVLSWCLKIPLSISKPVIKDSSQKVVKKIPEHYMESPQCLKAFQSLTSLLDLSSGSRDNLELIYSKFCQTVEGELIVRHQNPKNPLMKPWWSLELSKLRKDLRKALKFWQGNKSDPELKNEYTRCQHKFDKMVRQVKTICAQATVDSCTFSEVKS